MSQTRTDISSRHKTEWETFRISLDAILEAPGQYDDKYIRNIKYLADTIRITQDGERRAFDYSAGAAAADTSLQLTWETGEEDGKD